MGESLTLQTADGRVWFTATPLETGGELFLRTTDPRRVFGPPPGIQLRAEQDGKYVAFSDGGVFSLVHIAVQDGSPGIALFRRDGTRVVEMGLHPDGHGVIALGGRGPGEKPFWYVPADARLNEAPDDGEGKDDD